MQAVPAAQREKLFNTYLQAVQQLEVAAKEKASRARAAFQVCAFHLTVRVFIPYVTV